MMMMTTMMITRTQDILLAGSQTFKYSILDAVPPIHGESYHVATDKDPSMPPSWRQVSVYFSDNLQPIAERKHVARYWQISAVPVSAHPFTLVITTKLAGAILVVVVVRRRGSAGPVLPLWLGSARRAMR